MAGKPACPILQLVLTRPLFRPIHASLSGALRDLAWPWHGNGPAVIGKPLMGLPERISRAHFTSSDFLAEPR